MKVLVTQSCPTLCDPMDCSPPGSSVHGDSPGKDTGVDCHALLQGILTLNAKWKYIKLTEDNIEENLYDLRYFNEFGYNTSGMIQERNDELGFSEIKTYTLQKAVSREWEDKPQIRRKCFHMIGKRLLTKIFKKFLKLISKNNLILKMAKDLKRHLTKKI